MSNVKYHREITKLIYFLKYPEGLARFQVWGNISKNSFSSVEERNQVAIGCTENELLWGRYGKANCLLKKPGFENKTVMRFPKGQWHVYMSKQKAQLEKEKLKERKPVSDKTKFSK